MAQSSYIEAVAELEQLRATFAVLPSRYAGELGYAFALTHGSHDC